MYNTCAFDYTFLNPQVCGVDVPPEDRGFVRLFPELDPNLVSRKAGLLFIAAIRLRAG